MTNSFNNIDIFKRLNKRKDHLLLIVIIAIGLSSLFSSTLFIKPKFKSSTIAYPANLTEYSIESNTEQMLQVINSDDIMYRMIKKFNLAAHYGVDSTDAQYLSNIKEEYRDNFSIQKTPYEAVEIEVLDTDPKLAYQMANEIIGLYNLKVRELHREKAGEVVRTFKNHLNAKEKEIDSLERAIQEIRVKYGILDYEVQAKEATRRYLRTLGESGAKFTELTTIIRNLEEKGEEFQNLQAHLVTSRKSYGKIKVKYEDALRDYNKEFTFAHVVTAPIIPDKKSYPVRWVIVAMSTMSALFLAILFFSFADSVLKPVEEVNEEKVIKEEHSPVAAI